VELRGASCVELGVEFECWGERFWFPLVDERRIVFPFVFAAAIPLILYVEVVGDPAGAAGFGARIERAVEESWVLLVAVELEERKRKWSEVSEFCEDSFSSSWVLGVELVLRLIESKDEVDEKDEKGEEMGLLTIEVGSEPDMRKGGTRREMFVVRWDGRDGDGQMDRWVGSVSLRRSPLVSSDSPLLSSGLPAALASRHSRRHQLQVQFSRVRLMRGWGLPWTELLVSNLLGPQANSNFVGFLLLVSLSRVSSSFFSCLLFAMDPRAAARFQSEMNAEVKTLQDSTKKLQNLGSQRAKLLTQLQENEMVKKVKSIKTTNTPIHHSKIIGIHSGEAKRIESDRVNVNDQRRWNWNRN